MPTLIVQNGADRQRIALGARVLIGRAPGCDVIIDHPAVSRKHAVIEADGGSFIISDWDVVFSTESIANAWPLNP